ncbi:MAG: prenyltransferase [Bacteroidales bacterium]|nr:prenyltransferase [Bacteroidales bacterium]
MKKLFPKLSVWLTNARVGACVQSFMPAALAAILAIGVSGGSWILAILAILGVECAHLAMNLADDYFDYKVDMKGDRDRVIRKGFRAMTAKYPYLTDGSQGLKTTARAIGQFTIVAALCGIAIFVVRTVRNGYTGPDGSWWIPATALACGFLGFFYSAPPLKLAYRGLGELVVGLIFGPLLMTGVYYSAAGTMDWGIALISIPVGILVMNILFTHSFIDMAADAESNKMTFARLLGSEKACLSTSFVINLLPFALIIAAVCAGMLSPFYLIVLIILPRAIWLCSSLVKFCRHEEGVPDVPEKPYPWLGKMPGNWEDIRKAGIDWFLMRWLCARNVLSGFCLMLILAKVATLIFG